MAEIWIGRDFLWMTLFVDYADRGIKIELLPPRGKPLTYLVDFADAERLLESVKRDLRMMAVSWPRAEGDGAP